MENFDSRADPVFKTHWLAVVIENPTARLGEAVEKRNFNLFFVAGHASIQGQIKKRWFAEHPSTRGRVQSEMVRIFMVSAGNIADLHGVLG